VTRAEAAASLEGPVGVLRVNKAQNGMSPGRNNGATRGASAMRSYAAALHALRSSK